MNISEIVTSVLVALALIVGIILLIKIIAAPIKKIFKFLLNTVLGIVIMLIINQLCSYFGIQAGLDINVTQCAIAAIFGLPGVLLMILIKLFL